LGEAIQDEDSDWYYFCHSACRRWLSNLNFNLAYYGDEWGALGITYLYTIPSYDEVEVDDEDIYTPRLHTRFQ
jgi:hypothetical protein